MAKTGGRQLIIMLKSIIFNNQKKKLSDRGFITIEIIIALLIAFGFLMVSLQTLVAAMVFKVQAQEKQKADKLIQEDVERLNDIAGTLNLGANGTEACDGDLDNNGTANDGYSQNLWAALQADTPDGDSKLEVKLISKVNEDDTGKTLTLNRTQVTVPSSDVSTSHRVLGVSYQVTTPDEDGDGEDELIAQRYVEVIPDEALECP